MSQTLTEAKRKTGRNDYGDKWVNILGVRIVSTSLEAVLEKIAQVCKSSFKKPFFVTTINPEIVMLAHDDLGYKQILNSSNLPLADGVGLKFAKVNLQIVPGRRLVQVLIDKNYKSFFLGGKDDIASQMADKFGGLSDPGEVDIKHPVRNDQIVAKINKYGPDILLVAYGAPYQEIWISQNLNSLKAKVVIGVGGAFDYLTGKAKVPPEWLNSLGLEWAWRLAHEPWRVKRQISLARFVVKVWLG